MALRPRYSLLTLLVLTALVAGGVKLWYGPHHVVSRFKYEETEYTYSKSWDTSRIIDGPHIFRWYQPDGKTLYQIQISYYRRGQRLPWRYRLSDPLSDPRDMVSYYHGPPRLNFLRHFQMSEEEQEVCKQIIEQEYQRLLAQGAGTTDNIFIANKHDFLEEVVYE